MKTKFKIPNRILSLVLCLALVLSYLPSFTLTASAAAKDCTTDDCEGHYSLDGFCDVCGGYEPAVNIGTLDEGTVYQVSNAGQLYWFAKFINERTTRNKVHLWLANDITVNGYLLANGEVQLGNVDRIWTPIGNAHNKVFEGNVYGNGHTISGLYIPKSAKCDSAGFIGYYQYGTIRDLSIVDSYFAPVTIDYVGAQAGSITARSAKAYIQQCYSNAVIDSELAAGGIVGYSKGDNIVNCGFSGTIKILSNEGSAGGIIGTMDAVVNDEGHVIINETSINNCYSTCSLERADGGSDSDLGILVGTVKGGQITNFYYNSETNSGLELFGYIDSTYVDGAILQWTPTYESCVGKTSTEFSDGTVCGLIGYHLSHNGQCWLCSHVCETHTFEDHHCKNCGIGYTYVESLDVEVPAEVFQGTSLQLSTTVSPDSASFKDVIWTVTSGTATLSDNSVTFTTAGTVTLKATIKNGTLSGNDFNETFTVKVYSSVEIDVSKINGAFYDDALQIYESNGQLAIKYNQNELVTVPIGTQIVLTGSNTGKQYAMVEVASCANPVNLKIKNMTLSNSTYSALSVKKDVTLNLALEGTNNLTAIKTENVEAIYVADGATLNISGTGTLNAKGVVGIGNSSYNGSFGKVVINGGTVNASSNSEGAGIGAGYYGTGGTVIINGGTVTAKGGKYSAGIGGGEKAGNINITINGGVVNAYGSNGNTLSNTGGAGIGAGYEGSGGSITINGGTVYAKGGVSSAGIGGGDGGTVDSITITGGTVTAEGNHLGAGIGGGRLNKVDSIVITGGNIKASSGATNAVGSGGNTSSVTPVTDGTSAVSLVTATLDGAAANTAVSAVTGTTYGLKDVKTLDTNKLYFYLPSGATATSITAGGAKYFCKNENSLTYYTSHDWSNKDGVCAHCGEVCAHEGQTKTCTVCGKVLHEHDWTYEKVSDTKITATCTADGCDNPNGGYVTIAAPSSLTYTGSKIEAVVESTLTTGAAVNVEYSGSTTDGYPVNAGEYTASITMGVGDNAKTISVTYEIAAASIESANVSVNDAVYTGTAPEPTVTVKLGDKTLTEGTDYTVVYSNNTAVGTATVTVTGKGNYAKTAKGSFEIAYLTGAPDAAVSGTKGENGWYTSAVTLAAPDGYTISKTVDGAYSNSLTFADEQNKTVTYYLKNADGEIAEKTVELKIDRNAPTAKYDIKGNGWREFINFVSFGIFCKDTADLSITANDTLDDDVTVQYVISAEKLTAAEITNWNNYTDKVTLNPKAKNYIYIKVTDDAGNTAIYESGVVVFADSTENVQIEYTKHSTDDVTASIDFNGNTVKEVKYGSTVLTKEQYTVTDGGIQFKAAYLNTFAASDTPYTFTVSYNPVGETWVESNNDGANIDNAKIGTTTIDLTVKKATLTISGATLKDKSYDGTKNGTVTGVTFTETDKLALGTDYTATVVYDSENAGNRTATVTVTLKDTDKANAYTLESTTYTMDATIAQRKITVTATAQTITYGENITDDAFTSANVLDGHKVDVTLTPSAADVTVSGMIAVTVNDITVNGESVKGNYDVSVSSGKLTIQPDLSAISDLTAENVTSADKADIEAVKEMMRKADYDNADVETKAAWNAIVDNCDALQDKIKTVTDEITRVTDEADSYDADTVNSDDAADLNTLAADIKALTDSNNLTDEERTALNALAETVKALQKVIADTAAENADITDTIGEYTPESVKSDDTQNIEDLIDRIDTLLDGDNLTEDERAALEETKGKAQDLLDKIDQAANATVTESAEKVKDVTTENVTPENKTDLEKAKTDLEKALNEHEDNYTDEEKKAIEDEIKKIDEALGVVANVEGAEGKINALPDAVTKNDEAAIKAAEEAYNALSDYEKSLVDKDAKKALDNAKVALAELNKPADGTYPDTGDNVSLWLWVALLFVSGGVTITLTVCDKKRRI